MARSTFVKKSRKDNPAVKRGESYWWWKPNFGHKRYFKTKPTRSQMTNSSFLSSIWDVEDNLLAAYEEDEASELVSVLEELCEECRDSLENMPYHLQDTSDSGMRLTERIDGLEEWANEIQGIDWDSMSSEEAAQYIGEVNPGTW